MPTAICLSLAAERKSSFSVREKNVYPEEIEAHYQKSAFIREICVLGLTARSGEPFSERLHAVIVPDFDTLKRRKIVNAKEVIRFDVEGLSQQLASTKRILSYEIWQRRYLVPQLAN
jgi:long-subunit acyl-CoA synthetase (AMP-forming)